MSRQSIPLIRPLNPPEPEFVVDQRGVEYLSGLEGPLYVISVVGAMRQGKSFILNLLAGGAGIFQLGHQTASCTQGIDVFVRPHPSGHGHLVFLDVEGQKSPDRNPTYDAALTTVAMLLSSLVVYNCLSVGKSSDVDDLELLSGFMQNLIDRTSEEHGEEEAAGGDRFSPHLMWLLRDFFLEMVDAHGNTCDPDTYLEQVLLAPERGQSSKAREKNRKVNDIKTVIQKRCLRTLPRPVDDENFKQLDLHGLEAAGVRAEFREQVQRITQEILITVRVKRFDGAELTGASFAELAGYFTRTLNKDGVPEVTSAWQQVCSVQADRALQAALQTFNQGMETAFQSVTATAQQQQHTSLKPPLSEEQFGVAFNDAMGAARQAYFASTFNTAEDQVKFLDEALQNSGEEHFKSNQAVANSFCSAVLNSLYAPVRAGIESGQYACGGGFSQYTQDSHAAFNLYEECCKETLVPDNIATQVGKEFWNGEEHIRKVLLDSDKQLTQAEKEAKEREELEAQRELERKLEWEQREAERKQLAAEHEATIQTWEKAMGNMKEQMRIQQEHEELRQANDQREAQMQEFIRQGQSEAHQQLQSVMEMANKQAELQQENLTTILNSMQDSQKDQKDQMMQLMESLQQIANKPPPTVEVKRSCCLM